jgi:hypothetical protein
MLTSWHCMQTINCLTPATETFLIRVPLRCLPKLFPSANTTIYNSPYIAKTQKLSLHLAPCPLVSSIPHLPDVQIHSLPCHPALPLIKCTVLIARSTWPLLQVVWTCSSYNLGHAMPRKARRARHVDGTSRSQTKGNHLVVCPDDKDGIAPQTHAYKTMSTRFGNVAMYAESITRRVEVHNGGLCFCICEDGFQQNFDICRERWRRRFRILFCSPVVLAAQRRPAHLFIHELCDAEGLVDCGIYGRRDSVWGRRREREEGCVGGWVGEVVVRVDVCEVCWVGEITVQEAREQG